MSLGRVVDEGVDTYLEEDGHDSGEEDNEEHGTVAKRRAGLNVDTPVSAKGWVSWCGDEEEEN